MAQPTSHQTPAASAANDPSEPSHHACAASTESTGGKDSMASFPSENTIAGGPEPPKMVLAKPSPPSQPIQIPRDSFTAFRLAHLTPEEISVFSSTIFLGPVPNVWVQPPETTFLFAPKASRRSMRSWIHSTGSRLKSNLTSSSTVVRPAFAGEVEPSQAEAEELQQRLASILYMSTSPSSESLASGKSSRRKSGIQDEPSTFTPLAVNVEDIESGRTSGELSTSNSVGSFPQSDIGFLHGGQWPRGREPSVADGVSFLSDSDSDDYVSCTDMSQILRDHRESQAKEENKNSESVSDSASVDSGSSDTISVRDLDHLDSRSRGPHTVTPVVQSPREVSPSSSHSENLSSKKSRSESPRSESPQLLKQKSPIPVGADQSKLEPLSPVQSPPRELNPPESIQHQLSQHRQNPYQVIPPQISPDQLSPDQMSPDQMSPNQLSPQVSTPQSTSREPTPQIVSPQQSGSHLFTLHELDPLHTQHRLSQPPPQHHSSQSPSQHRSSHSPSLDSGSPIPESSHMLEPHMTPSLLRPSQPRYSVVSELDSEPRHSVSKVRSRVTFADPRPEDDMPHDYSGEYIRAERMYRRSMKKFSNLATASTERARAQRSKLKLNFRRLLKEKQAGEIIRVNKMLVLVKKSTSKANASNFTRQDSDAYVKDHWREYYVVLKKTDSFSEPLVVQYFDVHKGKKFDGSPDHSFNVRKGVSVDFYSHSDKTICAVDPSQHGMRIFIMNARFLTVAYTWLYLVKEILEEEFYPMVVVNLAESTMQFKIGIPRELILGAFSSPPHLTVVPRPTGYYVNHDNLIAYLETEIDNRLEAISAFSDETKNWRQKNPNPGFCFKFYDRVEWLNDSSASFVVQSQILQGKIPLEYREKAKAPIQLASESKEVLPRPLPVEGFLSRITTTSGKEYSKLRAFYKISYFFTAGHLLFFSKFLTGMPPSPNNALLEEDCERQSICESMPAIYKNDPFHVTPSQHIPWLSDSSFQKMDKMAVEEYSRRVQQIVSAEAMVDLLSVVDVRPLSPDTIISHHSYFQSYLWYSSPKTITEPEIADVGFEIEMRNGSKIKFLAPNRTAREEWVARLKATVEFWHKFRKDVTQSLVLTKLENQKRFNLDEFSYNAVSQPGGMESRRSVPNTRIFTNAGVAMSTVILHSGYLYQKQKKHSSFSQFFVVLCPGYIVIYSLNKRSKLSGVWKSTPFFERYLTIPISECYVHTEASTQAELVEPQSANLPEEKKVPRLYPDGWMSSEEDAARCFTIWFGGARALRKDDPRNPSLAHMVRKVGVTGKILVFLARSRQERESWVYNILQEINRFSGS